MPEIKFISGPMEGQVLALSAQKYTIGRKPNRDLFFNDESCSSEHAELRLENEAWSIVDLQSSNGTWLNQKKISSAVLASGDSVKIGTSVFVFNASPKQAHEKTSNAQAAPTASVD